MSDNPDRILRDFKIFSDPATPFNGSVAADRISVSMTRNGVSRAFVVDLTSGKVIEKLGNLREHASLAALFATEEFANVRALRETQRRVLSSTPFDAHLDPEGLLLTASGPPRDLDLASFRRAISPRHSSASLGILLIDGPAGVGKTSLIERMVFERADSASAEPPILHVRSSGSRLTDLNKALAHATQVLRASITFDQVPILVRHGVIQVAIDGFDELVDPAGYKDAWFALREFLQDVAHGGPVLLAGRDTFFDQQTFQEKLAQRIAGLQLQTARLTGCSPDGAFAFLTRNGWTDEDVADARAAQWFREGSYRLRAFFLAQIANAGGWDELRESYGSPQWFLVNSFVRREARLIEGMIPSLSTESAAEALWRFYGTIAEDMVGHEDEAVDVGYLSLACEMAFSDMADDDDLAKLVHKSASFGLLEGDASSDLRRFPHTELQEQFLARRIRDSLTETGQLLHPLRRHAVSATLAEAFSEQYAILNDDDAASVKAAIEGSVKGEMFSETLLSNVLCLRLAALTRPPFGKGAAPTIGPGFAPDARLVGTLQEAVLKDVEFVVLDVRSADCTLVTFASCVTGTLVVNDLTRFGETEPKVTGSLQLDAPSPRAIRAPDEVRAWLDEHSTVGEDDELDLSLDLPLVRFFDRVCRAFGRQGQIRDCSDDAAYHLLRHPLWDEVATLLGDRMKTTHKITGGRRDAFFFVHDAYSLLSSGSGDPDARQIRGRLNARAKVLAGEP